MYSTIHPLNQTGLSVEFREHHIEDHEEPFLCTMGRLKSWKKILFMMLSKGRLVLLKTLFPLLKRANDFLVGFAHQNDVDDRLLS